jgi:hypothetical protein
MAAMRRLVPILAAAVLAPAAAAATNPALTYLQKTLKADMVKTFKTKAPGLTITTVTCKLPANGVTATCKAHFTTGSVKGYYPVRATLHDVGGSLTWKTGQPKCTDAKTGRPVPCQSNTAKGYISTANAEQLLKSSGFTYKGATIRAASASCTGSKTAPSKNGAFSQLTCTVKGTDRHRYSVGLVMVGPKSVALSGVTPLS